MSRIRYLCMGLLFLLIAGQSAQAWNELGHITIAEIAFRQMSAEEREAVVRILRHHPHIDTYFKKPSGLDMPEDEWLFMRASTWCDSVRPPRDFDRAKLKTHPVYKFHRGPWHYIDYPYTAGQQVGAKLPPPLVPNEDEKTDAIQQLNQTKGILSGTITQDAGIAEGVTPEQNKAVRLCWLFHVVGDLHQPLHTTALVDQQLFAAPNFDDAGGNFCFIRTNKNNRPLNLHAYWDGLLGLASGWRDGKDATKMLQDVERGRILADVLTHGALAAEKLTELKDHPDYADWAQEGYRLCATIVYDNGNLQFTAKKDLVESQAGQDRVPVLPPLLQEKARATANKRVALAGYRLATQLQILAK